MNPYIKIKESPPFYIGGLALETKGIGKRIFHQIMFPKQLPSNSLGMVSLKVHVDFRSRHSTPYLNLEKAIKKCRQTRFPESLPAFWPPVNFPFSGNRYCCSLRFCKNMKHRNLFFNRLELKDLLNYITFLFDDGHPFQSYIKAS